MAEPAALVDLETLEVSLVGQGANLKRFAVRKGHEVSEVVKAALETEAEGEELLCKDLEGDVAEAARLAYRAIKAGELPEETRKALAKELGVEAAPEVVEEAAEEPAEEVEKALDPEVAAKLEAIEKRNEELTKALAQAEEARTAVEVTKSVETDMSFAPGSTDEKVALLLKARKAGLGDEVESLLKRASAQLGESELFKARGAVAGESDIRKEIASRVAKLRTQEPKLTEAQAFVRVMDADSDLKARFREENK